jgi:rfaE bifunctional protein kinase chain/domain
MPREVERLKWIGVAVHAALTLSWLIPREEQYTRLQLAVQLPYSSRWEGRLNLYTVSSGRYIGVSPPPDGVGNSSSPVAARMNRLTEDRLAEILDRASGVRVAVVGDLMLDVYLTGSASRISPEAPVPVIRVTEERVALGGAANVAANVAALGARCNLIGCIGSDMAGEQVRRVLGPRERSSISAHLVEHPDRPTTTKTRVMARHQQVVRFDRERDDDLAAEYEAELCDLVTRVVADADVLVLEDYNKGVLAPPVIRAALQAAARAEIPSVVDPKFRHFFEYSGATVFKPNALELAAALGTPARFSEDGLLEDARRRLGCTHLLVTLGENGMVLRSEAGDSFRIPAVAREVYDVSGAGDTVTACVAVALATGATVEEAAVLANFAAAIEVGKPGVATVAPDELRAFVSGVTASDALNLHARMGVHADAG